jgi:hypothetical protein
MAQSCENKNFNPAEERGMNRPVEQDLQRTIESIRRLLAGYAANVAARRDYGSYQRRADCAAAVRGS